MDNSINIHLYSERGMVNALILHLNTKVNVARFLNRIKVGEEQKELFTYSENDIKEVNIYDEISLGGFGSPDLLIKVETVEGKSFVFFFEAKITNFIDNSILLEDSQKIYYPGNASKLNVQLWLRYRFVNAFPKRIKSKEVYADSENDSDYERKLKKVSLIKEFEDNIMKKDTEFYYVALLHKLDETINLKNYFPSADYDKFISHFGMVTYFEKGKETLNYKEARKLAINEKEISLWHKEIDTNKVYNDYDLKQLNVNGFIVTDTKSSFSVIKDNLIIFKLFLDAKTDKCFFILREEFKDTYLHLYDKYNLDYIEQNGDCYVEINDDTREKIISILNDNERGDK